MKAVLGIDKLTIEKDKITFVQFSGDLHQQIKLAANLLESTLENIEHIQRPMKRKFDSLIAKLNALDADLVKHDEYVRDLEARKNERKEATENYKVMRKLMSMKGRNGAMLRDILGV